MAYYLNLFSPETYEAYQCSDQTVSGFRMRQRNAAERTKPGDEEPGDESNVQCVVSDVGQLNDLAAPFVMKSALQGRGGDGERFVLSVAFKFGADCGFLHQTGNLQNIPDFVWLAP